MEIIFKDKRLKKIYETGKSKDFSNEIIIKYIQKINILKNIFNTYDLKNLRSLNFEKLNNYKNGNFSIRVNKGYRIIFNIIGNEIKIIEVTDFNNHYN